MDLSQELFSGAKASDSLFGGVRSAPSVQEATKQVRLAALSGEEALKTIVGGEQEPTPEEVVMEWQAEPDEVPAENQAGGAGSRALKEEEAKKGIPEGVHRTGERERSRQRRRRSRSMRPSTGRPEGREKKEARSADVDGVHEHEQGDPHPRRELEEGEKLKAGRGDPLRERGRSRRRCSGSQDLRVLKANEAGAGSYRTKLGQFGPLKAVKMSHFEILQSA